jgi:hypothetical protein
MMSAIASEAIRPDWLGAAAQAVPKRRVATTQRETIFLNVFFIRISPFRDAVFI